ncbi:putative cuticle protein CPG42 [Operophtera brumata]|uniref:Putative cuticle protein CPG42 n=1 Tax=Operophtera brumata TaxID=104452 RepID=A0A0L7KYC0_OPEBR|nr:putative cuticle protein CPG42 [Operophtera brumata]
MLSQIITFAAIAVCAATNVELSNEKTPYDYVKERLDAIGTDMRTGLPLSDSYEVEESEDYPEHIEGAASTVLNTVAGVGGVGGIGGIGLGQGLGQGIGLGGLGYGGIGLGQGLGQGLGIGLGGLGGVGGLGVGGIGGGGIGGVGIGNGVGLINPGLGGIGVGGIGLGGGLGGGLLYHPLLGAQVGGGYADKKAYDEAQKKDAGENLEKIEKKAEEETKHGQEGFQQAAAAAKAEKGESSFYKDEEAKKKAAGDEKFYEGGQKFDKQGANEEQLKKAKSHKKGHVSKGFKSSSSKNEEEKSESFYDEAHDEADHKIAGQNAGSFGENSQQGFKGAHEEKILDANAQGKEGHHISEQKIDDSKANKGEFLQKGYKGGAEQLEKFNNLGAHSVHGHQEATGGYQQSKGILPIH